MTHSGRFTLKELETLKQAIEEVSQANNVEVAEIQHWPSNDLDEICLYLPHRKKESVVKKFRRVCAELTSSKKRSEWTNGDHQQLRELIGKLGRNWAEISTIMGYAVDVVSDHGRNAIRLGFCKPGQFTSSDNNEAHKQNESPNETITIKKRKTNALWTDTMEQELLAFAAESAQNGVPPFRIDYNSIALKWKIPKEAVINKWRNIVYPRLSRFGSKEDDMSLIQRGIEGQALSVQTFPYLTAPEKTRMMWLFRCSAASSFSVALLSLVCIMDVPVCCQDLIYLCPTAASLVNDKMDRTTAAQILIECLENGAKDPSLQQAKLEKSKKKLEIKHRTVGIVNQPADEVKLEKMWIQSVEESSEVGKRDLSHCAMNRSEITK
eukprot:TRINITY_DN1114_c0_g1_i2.p1 TRINITY_DN1114_c0_g1~~TRINITY_DN1114_c0_g1_i2.p1  ORF type:complete len:397 (-),score=68.11 TRINITY_DN1114_c0_g1_i2:398-1537(-)